LGFNYMLAERPQQQEEEPVHREPEV